jgi:hypothetical protein
VSKGFEILLRSVAVGLMLVGAMMLVAGIDSVLPFALITIGLALTVLLHGATRRPAGRLGH